MAGVIREFCVRYNSVSTNETEVISQEEKKRCLKRYPSREAGYRNDRQK
jgi:hypothetical protein